jgi:AcrR family transcriptional regulator
MANLIPKTPPAAWLAAARQALVDEGIQGVKVDRLAVRLGVTKGGFYKHFADRAELLSQLLALWEAENVFVPEVPKPSSAREARDLIVGLTDRLIDEAGFDPRFDMAVRDWARIDEAAAKALERVDRSRITQLRALFALLGCDAQEAEVRARVLYYHQIGYYALGVQESRSQRKRLLPTYMHILIGAEHIGTA